ncbi:MAG TPA: autoinducer 2 ABC transporter substrate-binding protein, partial [Citreicella sp.]|nr:autoinducer 2 ABC transporter substrate-binding protein [Citreicella sp.]
MTQTLTRALPCLMGSAAILAASFAAPAQAAWTGGDDQPTSPLACDASTVAPDAGSYNGGTVTGAQTSDTLRVVDVPKLVGIGYFNATSAGVAEAAAEL